MLLFSTTAFTQTKNPADTTFSGRQHLQDIFQGGNIVLGNVKYKPEFTGGREAWIAYLKSAIDLTIPAKKRAANGKHLVSIRFIVGKDGVIGNIGAESGCGYGMEDEVIKSLRSSPKWKPAQTAIRETVSFAARQIVEFTVKGSNISIQIL